MISEAVEAAECRPLFVYGTLRRGFELHHHLVRLGARFLTEAKVAAELVRSATLSGSAVVAPKREMGPRRTLPTSSARA